MTNLIENNAYRILGLDINANQKDILKRYKEIINRLKMDDYPEYDLDLNLPKKLRNETSVNDALKRLQSQKSNIKEYFFWFQINDSIDKKALKFIQEKDFAGAIQIWKNASKGENTTSYIYKKNLALLYCLILFNKNNASNLKESLSIWHELLSSEKFWITIIKKYTSSSEQDANSEVILDFRKNAVKNISDIYTELHRLHKDNKYVKDFQEIFRTHGERTEKNVLQPIYQSIYEHLEDLKKIEINDDTKIKETDIEKIYKIIELIQAELNKLEGTGSYKIDQSLIVRDHVAETIRLTSVLIYNHTTFLEDSSKLLKVAIKICGTDSLKDKLEEDAKQIKKNDKQALRVEISGWFSNKEVKFNNTFLEYKDKKIFYRDVDWVSYQATSHSINGIPTGTTYKFRISTEDDEISLSLNEETWNQFINLSKQLIEPIIIKKIIRQIFEKNIEYVIGGVKLNKKGYSRDKFWGGADEVSWGDRIFIPTYHAGQVILFKEENGGGKSFAQVSMDEGNSVLLPELIPACVEYYHHYGHLKKVEDKPTETDKNKTKSNSKTYKLFGKKFRFT